MSFRPPLPRTRMIGSKPVGAPTAGPVLTGKRAAPGGPAKPGGIKPGSPKKSC